MATNTTITYKDHLINTNENDTKTPVNTFTETIENHQQFYPASMNGIIAVVIINDRSCFEQPFTFKPTTQGAMIKIKTDLMKNNPNVQITGLIIMPPKAKLSDAFNKLNMNKLSIVMNILDIVIFGNEDEYESNLNLIAHILKESKNDLFGGFKFIELIKFRQFTEKAFDDFQTKRTIGYKNTYEKSLCDYKKLRNFVDYLAFELRFTNIVLEMKKKSDIYDEQNKLLAEYGGMDIIKDNKYYFVMASTHWNEEECSKILHRMLKLYTTNYDAEKATNRIMDMIKNYEQILASMENNHDFEYGTEFVFSEEYGPDTSSTKNFMNLLKFCRYHLSYQSKTE